MAFGRKKDGTLKKGFRFARGGKVVKSKSDGASSGKKRSGRKSSKKRRGIFG